MHLQNFHTFNQRCYWREEVTEHDIYVNYGYIEPSRMMRIARFKGYRRCSAVLYLFSFPVETMVAVLLVKN